MELMSTLGMFVLSIAVGVVALSFLTKKYGSKGGRATLFAGVIASVFFLAGMWFI